MDDAAAVTAREPLTLYSWLVSPYSAKVRSFLHYKRVRVDSVRPSGLQLYWTIKRAVGRAIMPTVQNGDGTWLQDSTIICDDVERAHPEPSVTPRSGAQQLASALIALLADEWCVLITLHWRWNNAGNAEWAVDEFRRNAFPWLPRWAGLKLATTIAKSMQKYRSVVGISEATHAGIELYTATLIKELEQHFSYDATPYLLGARPCRGDFALSAPLWAHLYRDPHTRALFDAAPATVRWMERLHAAASGNAPLPRRPDCESPQPEMSARPAAARDIVSPGGAGFLASGRVPATLDWFFATLFAECWPYVAATVAATEDWVGTHPGAQRVPRALGPTPFVVGGAHGARTRITFVAWKAQRPIALFAALRGEERHGADIFLRRVGGYEHLIRTPRCWLERVVAGERGEELRPTRLPLDLDAHAARL